MNAIRKILSNVKKEYLRYRRSSYFNQLQDLIKNKPSIISNNCFAGRIYQDFDLEYNSPTAGLYMFYPDYIEFLLNIESNLKGTLEFVKKSKYDLGNKRIKEVKHPYPLAVLNGKIEIHFLHYKDEEEAAAKWYKRAARVDVNNLIVFGGELDLCTEKDIQAFDELPFPTKLFFTANKYDYKCCLYMKEFRDKGVVGDPYQYGHVFYRYIAQALKNERN